MCTVMDLINQKKYVYTCEPRIAVMCAYAQSKGEFINKNKHLVLVSPHPSPLSAHRGFFGNGHFSKANAYLLENGKSPVNW